ncbi:hypothetical protein [Streptomyces chrestomyceticus]
MASPVVVPALAPPAERWGTVVPGAEALSVVPMAFSITAAVRSAGEKMSLAKAAVRP